MDRRDNFHGAHRLLSPHGPLHGQVHLHDKQQQSNKYNGISKESKMRKEKMHLENYDLNPFGLLLFVNVR